MNKLTDIQFEKYKKLVYDSFGIHLNEIKKEMVQCKLGKLMRSVEIEDYDEYLHFLLNNNNGHWSQFADEITIHKTNFFREDNHFDFLRNKLSYILDNNPRIVKNNEIRVWSAGCSTGEEPYTIAMVLKEYLPPTINIKILATDVSNKVIKEAQEGEYILDQEDAINAYYLAKYFTKKNEFYCLIPEIKKLIIFRTFNLLHPFPFKYSFDIIFCRNVMIYFDFDFQEQLIKKYYNSLTPGGLLFIGHSESLTQKQYKFKYIQPTVYMRTE